MGPASNRPLIKICGITRREDAVLAAELGADLIGLNFWPGSPRRVSVEEARRITGALDGRTRVVGVFVDAPRLEIAATAEAVGLDLVQFHGDEPPESVAAFGVLALKAFRVAGSIEPAALAAHPDAWGFLFDVHRAGRYGGTGEAWDWARIAALVDRRPRLVAGGIRPDNARRAIAESRASGIDVCSGVEARPGVKDPALLRSLFAALARDAA